MASKRDKQEKPDKAEKREKKAPKAERIAENGHVAASVSDGFVSRQLRTYSGMAGGGTPFDGPVVILGARLIDGTGADPVDDAALVIEGERITAAGRRRDVRVPAGATVIEADGKTLLPGLIDCHVHLRGQWGYDLLRGLMTPPSLSTLYAVPNARATLEAGITTVRDAGGTPAAVKAAIDRGMFPGPRMLVAVSFLSQTGGHGDHMMPCCIDLGDNLPSDIPLGVVDGLDEMRKKAREILRAGADWIKLCTSGGVLSPADSPESAQFTVDEIAVAVYEAAAQGKRCMAHAQSNRGIKNALEAGIASIEHGIYLDDEAIQMMLDRNVYLVPTLVAPADVIDLAEARPGLLPAYAVEKSKQVMATHRESFRRAVAAGVKVAMGTDSGVGPHGGNARELALMVEHGGMTPLQAITASTHTAAELLRLDDRLGALAPGMLADLLVVDGDPLADIHLLSDAARLALVMKGGACVCGELATAAATAKRRVAATV
ncbi:MAG: aryldialkylphosphatase related protein [Ktedonobacterales bacterium]|jgi:imidazolonepropionase-like amidohydrolase|nr:MAG: aryldialkylphosphatase related protein [Ktedonobacterales bacterium]